MPTFRDNNDREWAIRFDGLTLRAMREELKIDLADVSGQTYQRLESDDAELTAAICYLCREQLVSKSVTKQQLADALAGEALERAMGAVWGAAKVFFRPRLLSALESNYVQRKEAQATIDKLAPAGMLLNHPDMPEALREAVMGQVAGMLEKMTGGDSQQLQANLSASGLVATPSTPAIDSPASAVSTPAA